MHMHAQLHAADLRGEAIREGVEDTDQRSQHVFLQLQNSRNDMCNAIASQHKLAAEVAVLKRLHAVSCLSRILYF